jgi:hypothetical protein
MKSAAAPSQPAPSQPAEVEEDVEMIVADEPAVSQVEATPTPDNEEIAEAESSGNGDEEADFVPEEAAVEAKESSDQVDEVDEVEEVEEEPSTPEEPTVLSQPAVEEKEPSHESDSVEEEVEVAESGDA